ncbi:MAG: 2-isopropylmalate synthase [Candidatus Hodarchaeaceae archaeon]|nr:2-isopropylmalate synthase [Candidatus Hodarchaeaceae archaeon]
MAKRRVKVLDTTLRDGEQTPGVALAPEQKLELARALDDLGVDIIEAGAAITSEGERKAIKLISRARLDAEICNFARGVRADIDAALACDVDSVHLVIPTSDIHLKYKLKKTKREVWEMALDVARYALDHGLTVEFSAEDASRTGPAFLREFLSAAVEEGVQRVCACDTVGVLTPESSRKLFSDLAKRIKVPVATHCHDDFGMATANTLAAVQAGASEVHVTVNGLGERGGNAALEEVVLGLSHFHGIKTGIKLNKLYSISKLVERLTGLPVSPTKAVVGENAFTHEAGIHTHGVLVYPPTYEPISPEVVGHHRKLVFGKHVGSHAIESELKRMGLKPTKGQVHEIFEQVKRLGDRGKLVTDTELRAIVDEVMGRELKEMVKLEELTVVSGNRVTPTSSVKVRFGDKEVIESGLGVGPVDAAMNAIRKVVEGMSNVRLQEYHVDAISGGTDAVVSVVVKLTDGKRIVTARGTSGDIIMASVQAMLNGVNRLLWDRKLGGA